MKLSEVLEQAFEERRDLSVNTRRVYRCQLDKLILPNLGDLDVPELTSLDIHDIIQEAREDYKKNYVKTSLAAFSSLLNSAADKAQLEAEREQRRARRAGEVPDRFTVGRAADLQQAANAARIGIKHLRDWRETSEENVMTPEQREVFLSAARGSNYFVPIFVMAEAGIRPGEVCALQLTDLDFDRQKIRVVRKVYRRTVENKLKNKRPRKPAAMSDSLKRVLEAYLPHRIHKDTVWLFPSRRDPSRPISPNAMSNAAKKVLRTCGLGQFNLYANRHTAASLMLANGVPITGVAAQLGHANPSTTMKVYSHHIDTGDNVANAISGSSR